MSPSVLSRTLWAGALLLSGAGASLCALGQAVPVYPQTQYPTQPGAGQPVGMRQIFAESLAAVVSATGSSAANAVTAGLTGAISGWLDRKSRSRAGRSGSSYAAPSSGYPAAPRTQDYPSYPSSQPAPAYPAYPAYPSESPQQPSPAAQSEVYAGASPTYPAGGSPPIYAGIAYEIHLLAPRGGSAPVDPTTYVFRTGDRFQVLYRPSLPGRVDVFNVNAAGQQTQIDSTSVAAGQLATLGPYEFADLTGDETLILSLSPCSTPALMTATRNIVKVMDGPVGGTAPLQLSACGGAATRGLRTKTRDIRKVSVEQGTSFALDPLGASELSSGDVEPRQVTLTLAHR
jgi:hypothetical protein